MSHKHTDIYDRDCDAALGWIARLHSDQASEEDRQAFALWLGANPTRRRAFDNMLALWDDLGSVRHPQCDWHPRTTKSEVIWE